YQHPLGAPPATRRPGPSLLPAFGPALYLRCVAGGVVRLGERPPRSRPAPCFRSEATNIRGEPHTLRRRLRRRVRTREADLRWQGISVDNMDLLIGATALVYDLTVVTEWNPPQATR